MMEKIKDSLDTDWLKQLSMCIVPVCNNGVYEISPKAGQSFFSENIIELLQAIYENKNYQSYGGTFKFNAQEPLIFSFDFRRLEFEKFDEYRKLINKYTCHISSPYLYVNTFVIMEVIEVLRKSEGLTVAFDFYKEYDFYRIISQLRPRFSETDPVHSADYDDMFSQCLIKARELAATGGQDDSTLHEMVKKLIFYNVHVLEPFMLYCMLYAPESVLMTESFVKEIFRACGVDKQDATRWKELCETFEENNVNVIEKYKCISASKAGKIMFL